MFDFVVVQAIYLVFGGYAVAALLGELIPVDSAKMPPLVARLTSREQVQSTRLSHWIVTLGAPALIVFTQYLMWSSLVFAPTWALAYGGGRFIAVVCVEVPLLVWTITVVLLFRRAARRSR